MADRNWLHTLTIKAVRARWHGDEEQWHRLQQFFRRVSRSRCRSRCRSRRLLGDQAMRGDPTNIWAARACDRAM